VPLLDGPRPTTVATFTEQPFPPAPAVFHIGVAREGF
jgi:hypothetical protein